MTAEDFEIQLPLFKGPFDLLLFFIERDELDIYDIPISKISNDFLDYIHRLEVFNVELASEFILVAATLMRIKSKMLLPRPQMDEEGNLIDPREELVQHLLEYKKYKSVIEIFQKLEGDELQKEKRGNVQKEIRSLTATVHLETELQDVDLYQLMRVLEKVMSRYAEEKNRPIHQVIQYPYTIEGQKEYILNELTRNERISFREMLTSNYTRVGAIFNFLAILDLLAMGKLDIQIGEGFNNFWITLSETVEISS